MRKGGRGARRDMVSECSRIIDTVLIGERKLSPPRKHRGKIVGACLLFGCGMLVGAIVTLLLFL